MLSAEIICCMYLITLLVNGRIEANSVDPDQTAPTGSLESGSTLFVEEASKTFQQTTFVVIGTLRVNYRLLSDYHKSSTSIIA